MSTMTITAASAHSDDPDALSIVMRAGRSHLTGTKLACGAASCGACTVLRDGAPA